MEYYRSDGVRITHDPYHPDMAEKYGELWSPLLRMASNNLAVDAKSLLESGADPGYKENAGNTPIQCAMSSRAVDVVWGPHRKETTIKRISVAGAGIVDVNGDYVRTDHQEIPEGFDKVCKEQE